MDLNQLFPSLPQPGGEEGDDYSDGNDDNNGTKTETTTKKELTTKKEDERKQGDSGARTMNIPNFCLLIGGIFIFLKVY